MQVCLVLTAAKNNTVVRPTLSSLPGLGTSATYKILTRLFYTLHWFLLLAIILLRFLFVLSESGMCRLNVLQFVN